MRAIRRSIVRAGLLVGVVGPGAALGLSDVHPAYAAAPRPISRSYYVEKFTAVTPSDLINWGCKLATLENSTAGSLDVTAILAFGGQTSPTTYSGWSGAGWTATNVSDFVQGFVNGYAFCANVDTNSKLTVSVATNNSFTSTALGKAHHNTVNAIASTVASFGFSNVTVVGGVDMEPGYSSAAGGHAWKVGWTSTGGVSLDDTGSADACPGTGTYVATTPCYNGWTVSDIYTIETQSNTFSIPQIYSPSLSNQWYRMSAYGYATTGGKIRFVGIMTQYSSCHPNWRTGCAGLDWLPDSGYDDFQAKLNADPNTRYTIPFDTDFAHSTEALAGTLPAFP
jgi:hypothetical protein